jgi:hypothetical protein
MLGAGLCGVKPRHVTVARLGAGAVPPGLPVMHSMLPPQLKTTTPRATCPLRNAANPSLI